MNGQAMTYQQNKTDYLNRTCNSDNEVQFLFLLSSESKLTGQQRNELMKPDYSSSTEKAHNSIILILHIQFEKPVINR